MLLFWFGYGYAHGTTFTIERFANTATPQTPTIAWTTLAGSIGSGDLTLTVASVTQFPTLPHFRLLVENELMLVTHLAGTTWTVTRGIEGTTAAAHLSGANVFHILTAASLIAATIGSSSAMQMLYNKSGAVGGFGQWNGSRLRVTGAVRPTSYQSADGTVGATGTATGANTLTVKNGIIVGIT